MTTLRSLEDLKNWEEYRDFFRAQLKLLDEEDCPVYVSKAEIDFEIDSGPWSGHVLLVGKKAEAVVQKLRKEGVSFREGICSKRGKTLVVDELPDALVKAARRTLQKLLPGLKILSGEDAQEDDEGGTDDAAGATDEGLESALQRIKDELSSRIDSAVEVGGEISETIASLVREASDREEDEDLAGAIQSYEEIRSQLSEPEDELARHSERIRKAAAVWRMTEDVATRQLRRLQKAILALEHPHAVPVITGLESALTRLGDFDAEASAAAEAAQRGDVEALGRARRRFRRKIEALLAQVQEDELIRDLDSNPAVELSLRETIVHSLNKLLKAL